MALQLLPVLDRYFAAQNAHDIEGMVACFAPDAVVRDEGHDILGTEAIRAWKVDTSGRYHIRVEPIASHREGERTVVVVKVSGAFPGSPANLTYQFGFSADGRIDSLAVR